MAPPVNILGSRRGPARPSGGGGSVPVNTVAPTISGSTAEGGTLSGTDGTWTNSPTSFEWRWQRADNNAGLNTIDVSGTTSVRVNANADVGDFMRRGVRGVNAAGAGAWAYSSWIGPITSTPAGTLSTTFQVTSLVGGTSLPFAFGHAFRQGEVTASQLVLAGGATAFQCSPITFWPDGSLRHAILAGRVTCTANVAATLTLGAGVPPGGTALTTADLQAAMPASTSIAVGGTTMLLGGAFLASPFRVVCSGPVMSNWIYRQPVAGSDHLVIWADVRLYAGGNIEIFPWVENAYLLVAGSASTVGTACAVTVGGVSQFSQSINIAHHTRVPLLSGGAVSYWTGTNPQITPRHNIEYLTSTGLVPRYRPGAPTETRLNSLIQSYTPNTLAGVDTQMGSAGNSGRLIADPQVMYLTSNGDVRAWRAALVHGLSSGSWSIHFRDEATNEPLRFSTRATLSLGNDSSVTVPPGTGATNGTAAVSHMPSWGYLPYLLTGRWYFLEADLFWATYGFLGSNVAQRNGLTGNGADYTIDPTRGNTANRGGHWMIRQLAQAAANIPPSHPCQTDFIAAWQNNTAFYRGKFVDGTIASGAWVSPQGYLGDFSEGGFSLYHSRVSGAGGTPGVHWWGAAWMSAFGPQAWGFAWDIGIAQSTASRANHQVVRDHAYKQVVERAGSGTGGAPNWRRFIVYEYPIGTPETNLPVTTWYTSAQSYAAFLAGYGLTNPDPTEGLALTQRYSNAALVDNNQSDMTYGVQQMAALAYAAQHGVPGAVDGWRRVSTASNYASLMAPFVDEPAHSIIPRDNVPAWVSALPVLQWHQIPNTNLSSVQTGFTLPVRDGGGDVGTPGGVLAFSGGSLKADGSEIFIFGGGHADWAGNEVYSLRLANPVPAWVRRTNPTVNVQSDVSHYNDGLPSSRHTYNAVQFIDQDNRMMTFGAASVYGIGSGRFNTIDAFNPDTNTWAPAFTYANGPAVGEYDLGFCRGPNGDVFCLNGAGRFVRWNRVPRTWTDLAASPIVLLDGQQIAMCYDTARDRVMVFANNRGHFNPTTGAFTGVTFTGPAAGTIPVASAMSWVYVPERDSYMGWARGSNSVWECNASTFSVAVLSLSGTAPPASPQGNAIDKLYNRMMYVPQLKMVVFVMTAGLNVYGFKVA
jgi:hypothetical protein